MRMVAIAVLTLLGISSDTAGARAQAFYDCKDCRVHQRTCTANYSVQTCKTEYDRCMKLCRRQVTR
jgi:hypothetical protein